jgi:2-polyprenyl-6-methoxyphenol hydroxylase-like FAD-dependent oxidoreductase
MRTLVAGSGIAGLAAAIAIRKAGHDVVVSEKASELREIGAALSLWPNAMAALDHLGLAEQIRSRSLEAPTASIRSSSGDELVRFDAEKMRGALGGLPVVILRADLQTALLEACHERDIEVRLSAGVRDVRVDRGNVVVVTDAAEEGFDALVGADGINSTVRRCVSEQGERRDCNRTAWRAVIANDDSLIDRTWLTLGTGLQFIASPAAKGLPYWAADTPKYTPATAQTIGPKQELSRLFGSWHEPIPAIIGATPAEAIIVTDIFDRKPPRRLCRGRVVLVGDAAHAMTPDLGQGACQGLEDAAVLLACAKGTADAQDMFAAFERRRLRHVRMIVRDSYAIGRIATTSGPLAARLRNRFVRLTPETLNNRRLAGYASVKSLTVQAFA